MKVGWIEKDWTESQLRCGRKEMSLGGKGGDREDEGIESE